MTVVKYRVSAPALREALQMLQAPVSRTRSSRGCSATTFANFGFKRDTRIIELLVSLWFGSSLRSNLRTRANFRTATLAADHRQRLGTAQNHFGFSGRRSVFIVQRQSRHQYQRCA